MATPEEMAAAAAAKAKEEESKRLGDENREDDGAVAKKIADDAAAKAVEDAKAKSDADSAELARLKAFEAKTTPHIDGFDNDGNPIFKAREKEEFEPPTKEQLAQEALAQDVTARTISLIEAGKAAEEKIVNEFKAKDPLFTKNIVKMREKLARLPAAAKTEATLRKAYDMAVGESHEEYRKLYVEQGRQAAIDEISRGGGATLPLGGGGGGGNESKPDLTKIMLSKQQLNAAQKMIAHGMIKNLDQYKENLIYMEGQEEEAYT